MDEEYASKESGQSSALNPIKTSQDALINCSRDPIWSVDKNLKLITANTAFRKRVELLTKHPIMEGDLVLYKEFGKEVNKHWAAHYAKALEGERFTIKEEQFNTVTGEVEYRQITFNPMYNADQEVFGLACYAKDITEDTLNLMALEMAKNDLQKIMDSSLDMICVVDENDRIVKISAASESILGYLPEELAGTPLFDYVHPEDKEQTKLTAAKVMAGENLTYVENRYIHKNGSVVPLIWSARWDSKDKLRYGIARDATEKKKSEEALVASERMYRYLFEKNPFPIVLWDFGSFSILDCNEAASEKYGYTKEEFLKLTIKELRHPDDIQLLYETDKPDAPYSEHDKKVWRHKKKNGEILYADVTGHLMDYHGRRVTLSIMNDVTESRYYQELDKLEKNILELNAGNDKSIRELVNIYLTGIESLHPGMFCAVRERRGDRLCNLAAPSLPEGFLMEGEGIEIGQDKGPGRMTAFSKQKVVVSNTSKNEHWMAAYESAAKYKLNTCWSYPILDAKDELMATFDVYFPEIKSLADLEENTLQRTAQLLQLILESDQKERALKISNERFEYAAEATSDIIWDWDLETNAVYYSGNIEKLFGHNRSGLNDNNLSFYFDHVHPDDRERVVLYPEQVKFGQINTLTQEYRFKKWNGDYATVLDKGIVIRDETGKGIRMIGAIQDITRLKQQNERLNEIALINAHEIRRPVATILGLAQLFAMESAGAEANHNLLKHLETATLELDSVIRRIIGKTEH